MNLRETVPSGSVPLATQNVVCNPAALVSAGSLLEVQTLSSHFRPPKRDFAYKVWRALLQLTSSILCFSLPSSPLLPWGTCPLSFSEPKVQVCVTLPPGSRVRRRIQLGQWECHSPATVIGSLQGGCNPSWANESQPWVFGREVLPLLSLLSWLDKI